MFFRAYTNDGSAEGHFIKIGEGEFWVDKQHGNCLRLKEGLEVTLGQYNGYPGDLRRDGIKVVDTFGTLARLVGYTTIPVQTQIPGKSLHGHVVTVTMEGFRIAGERCGDCVILAADHELLLMRSRGFLEARRRGESFGEYLVIAELVEAFGIVLGTETQKVISAPLRQIPLNPA